jgi:hypothetical protein
VAAAGAEIGDVEAARGLERSDLLPHRVMARGVEHLELELAHPLADAARAQLVEIASAGTSHMWSRSTVP